MDEIGTPTSAILKHLSGYNLPPDNLYEIRALCMKRFQAPFSVGLSEEGRLAMKQTVEEFVQIKQEVVKENTEKDNQTQKRSAKSKKTAKSGKRKQKEDTNTQNTQNGYNSEAVETELVKRVDNDTDDKDVESETEALNDSNKKEGLDMDTSDIVVNELQGKTEGGDTVLQTGDKSNGSAKVNTEEFEKSEGQGRNV